jgi:hypothetical protein
MNFIAEETKFAAEYMNDVSVETHAVSAEMFSVFADIFGVFSRYAYCFHLSCYFPYVFGSQMQRIFFNSYIRRIILAMKNQ